MSIGASGLFYMTFRDILGTAQLAVDLDSDTSNKIALFTNSVTTPNFDSNTAYNTAPFDANETYGGSWAQGGYTLVGTSFSVSTGTLVWTATAVSQITTTITNARGGLIYGLASGTKNAVCLVNFVSDYSTSNGTFAITWSGSGIFTIDLTP